MKINQRNTALHWLKDPLAMEFHIPKNKQDWSEKRLIWVEPFEKHGYTRKARNPETTSSIHSSNNKKQNQ